MAESKLTNLRIDSFFGIPSILLQKLFKTSVYIRHVIVFSMCCREISTTRQVKEQGNCRKSTFVATVSFACVKLTN